MGTKAQLIDYIASHYTAEDGTPVSMSKLDSLKKAELEEFIKLQNMEDDFKDWLKSK
jgi:hypothetical protein